MPAGYRWTLILVGSTFMSVAAPLLSIGSLADTYFYLLLISGLMATIITADLMAYLRFYDPEKLWKPFQLLYRN